MTIDFGNGYRLVPFDSRNYKLQHFHAPNPNNPSLKSDEPKWNDTGNYFQQVGAAARFVWEAALREKDVSVGVAGALLLMAEEADRIKAAIGAAA